MFLLSYEEATSIYYTTNDERKTIGSDYAKCQGLLVPTPNSSLANYTWWLRSPDNYDGCYAYAIDNGAIQGDEVTFTFVGVRPACWIKL